MAASLPQNEARDLLWGRQGVMIAVATRLALFVAVSLCFCHDCDKGEWTHFTCN